MTTPGRKTWICWELFLDLFWGGFFILLLISEAANLPTFTAYLTKCRKRIFCRNFSKHTFQLPDRLHPLCVSCLLRLIKRFSVLDDLRRVFTTLRFQTATGPVKRQVNCYWGLKHFSQCQYCGQEELTPSPFSPDKEQPANDIFSTTVSLAQKSAVL